MLYRVFNTQEEVNTANSLWLQYREDNNIHDAIGDVEVEPQITTCWDMGRLMLDGRIACAIPQYGCCENMGITLELDEQDFPQPQET